MKKMKIIMLLVITLASTISIIPVKAGTTTDYIVICTGVAGPPDFGYCVYFNGTNWVDYSSPTMSPCARMRICTT